LERHSVVAVFEDNFGEVIFLLLVDPLEVVLRKPLSERRDAVVFTVFSLEVELANDVEPV
jgi:hypothetical protein